MDSPASRQTRSCASFRYRFTRTRDPITVPPSTSPSPPAPFQPITNLLNAFLLIAILIFVSSTPPNRFLFRVLVKRQLRLIDLQKDNKVSPEDMAGFCFSLRKYAVALAPLMQGLSVVASDQFFIRDDGALCIPYNFK